MAKVVIKDIPRLNGSYEFDLGRFTNDELRLIKREAGVRAGEIEDALRASDNDLLVCFALIALRRAGHPVVPEQLWEAEAGSLELDFSDEEDDADPPSQSGSGESGNEPPASS